LCAVLGRTGPPVSGTADAAGAWAPASLGFGQGNARVGKLQGVLAEVQAVRVGSYDDRKEMLAVVALADGGGPNRRQGACAREGETRASYSGRRLGAHEGHSSRGVGTGMCAPCYAYGGDARGRAARVGAFRSVRARHVAQEERAGRSVGARGSPDAQTDRPRAASACGPSRTARRRATPARALERQGQNSSNWHALTLFFSKKLN
jgi:hypothetical protein